MIYFIYMCKYSMYKFKLSNGCWSKGMYNTDVLYRRFDIDTIKRFIIQRKLVIMPCGKCDNCRDLKRSCYKNRVNSQLKLTKYSYLITITLNNEQAYTLLNYQERKYCLNNQKVNNYSQFTNLSKIAIDNVIKNWKNKLNRYYGDKVDFNYFLCGEYGANTRRSHYHILLMLDRPIPDLEKLNIKGDRYKSKLMSSKKFGLYDIQQTNGSINTAAYITKYLNKPLKSGLSNFNRFEEKLIQIMLKNDIDIWNMHLWPNKETLIRDLLLYVLMTNNCWYDYMYLIQQLVLFRDKKRYKDVTNQREFLKMSRKLGITDDMFYNLNNKVINNYYRAKYKFLWSQCYYLLCSHLIKYNQITYKWYDLDRINLLIIYLMLCYQLLFKILDMQRIANIKRYFHLNITRADKNVYKYNKWRQNDIF